MLSDEEKREMLEDARSPSRRKEFAQAKKNQPLSWGQYFGFLKAIGNLFPQKKSLKKIEGNMFRL